MSKLFSLPHRTSRCKADSNKGLTLIECLVAIAVIALTSASIAPVMILSVATRVQNQKVEQALQIAQGEVDRVRLLVERTPIYSSPDLRLAEYTGAPIPSTPTSGGTAITTMPVPTSSVSKSTWTASGYTPTTTAAKEIDTNGDNVPDFVVQSFRGGAVMNNTMPVAFDMGVRVYDYNAVRSAPGTLVSGLDTEAAGLGFTSGEGQRGRRPLAVLYTQISNSDSALSLCGYVEYLGNSVPATMNCN